ncbi:MAG: hypothetical protein ACI9NT_000089 [Bacteroidia bacterium]|jgi:uncharacterized protein (TIGR01777 family)
MNQHKGEQDSTNRVYMTMNILITGSSGLVGTHLMGVLAASGHKVQRMLRGEAGEQSFFWDPTRGTIHFDEAIKIDAVIHLAGESIANGRWSDERKKRILESRESSTLLLSESLATLKHRPAVLISGSAIGYYGDTDTRIVDEDNAQGTGFLAEVSERWEKATKPASDAGIRTVHIRTGVVLSPNGGMLQKLLLPFKMGLGGIVGSGQQYLSWVSINDIASMIQFLLENESMSGAVNLVSKQPVTNYTFTKTLGSVLNRPTVFPLPSWVARLVFGEMADALLLSSTRVLPKRLSEAGYNFIDVDLDKTLQSLL